MKTRFPAVILALALCLGLCAVPAFAVEAIDATEEDIKSTFTILRNGTMDETEGRYRAKEPVIVDEDADGNENAEVYYHVYGQGDRWTITNTGSTAISANGNTDYTISFTTWQYGYLPWEGSAYGWVGGTSTIDAAGNQVHAPDEGTKLANLKAGESITIAASTFMGGDGPYEGGGITALSIDIHYPGDPELTSNGVLLSYVFYFVGDDAQKAAMDQEQGGPSFTDVPGWCAPAVGWAVENEITEGVGGNRFAPSNPCTHAQILTFLWRAEGEPPSTAALPVDISGKNLAYAETALRWAAEKGMIGEGFDPTAPCTRGDAVIYIWKAFDTMGADGWFGFIDVDDSDEMLFGAVSYAVCCGIANGYDNGDGTFSFRPGKVCSRGEIVTLLHRAYVPEASLNPS